MENDIFTVLIIAAIIGLIPAAIAQSKGKDFWAWWFFGAAFFIVALPIALLMPRADPNENETRQLQQGILQECPFCADLIKSEAIICKHCGKEIPLHINHGLNIHRDFAIIRSEVENGAEKIIEENGKRFSVKIPAGIKEGTLLRVRGKGTTRDIKGKNISGDLYIKIIIQDDDMYI